MKFFELSIVCRRGLWALNAMSLNWDLMSIKRLTSSLSMLALLNLRAFVFSPCPASIPTSIVMSIGFSLRYACTSDLGMTLTLLASNSAIFLSSPDNMRDLSYLFTFNASFNAFTSMLPGVTSCTPRTACSRGLMNTFV